MNLSVYFINNILGISKLHKKCSQATGVIFVFCGLRVKLYAMNFTEDGGERGRGEVWNLKPWAK